MGLYDRYVVPALISFACGAKPIGKQRQKVVPLAQGVVLELGFGSGLNLPYYDPSKVTKLFALEPAPGMLARARKATAHASVPVEGPRRDGRDTVAVTRERGHRARHL